MRILYSAILRDSDSPKEAPRSELLDRSICYLDRLRPVVRAHGWETIVLSGVHPRRAAWRLRCNSHHLFPTADQVIWIDASFRYLNLERLIQDAGDAPIAGLHHPHRSSAYDEGPVLVEENRGGADGVRRQLDAYREEGFVPTGLTTAGVLIRRHTPQVIAFNEMWLAEIEKWPDDNTQLSLDRCVWKAGLSMHYLEGSYIDNPYLEYDHEDHKAHWRPYR